MWQHLTVSSLPEGIIPEPQNHFSEFAQRMEEHGSPHEVISLFRHYYDRILAEDAGMLQERDILPVKGSELIPLDELDAYTGTGQGASAKAVMIRLNGGLGTSMGMTHAKTLLIARDNQSFLDIILQQRNSTGWRLALMDSFSTHDDTLQALGKLPANEHPDFFMQHMVPKVDRETLRPAAYSPNPELEWNPPGHGDIYAALYSSGLLDRLLADGRRYAFLANGDNLGASPHPAILGYMIRNGIPFLMEVARRTKTDCKGGHLARLRDGTLALRELAQCPPECAEAFQNIHRHSLFNTNNLWIDLLMLRERIAQSGLPRLPMILNPKTVNPADSRTSDVFQVETAMGAAISIFPGAQALVVPRSRFIPVKKCGDLLALRSDAYRLDRNGRIRMNPARKGVPLAVTLEGRGYAAISAFEERFPAGPPSLLKCRSLSVRGDVRFEGGVRIEGECQITNESRQQAVIPAGSVLTGTVRLK